MFNNGVYRFIDLKSTEAGELNKVKHQLYLSQWGNVRFLVTDIIAIQALKSQITGFHHFFPLDFI